MTRNRITCKEALGARYWVFGTHLDSGINKKGSYLTHSEAVRYYNGLVQLGFKVIAAPSWSFEPVTDRPNQHRRNYG